MKNLIAISGTHGCFIKDTRVRMHDGSTKRIQDVNYGNWVMGADFKPRTVIALRRGIQQMYRIRYADGTTHTYNADHTLILDHATHAAGRIIKCNDDKIADATLITVKDFALLTNKEQRRYFKYKRPIVKHNKHLFTAVDGDKVHSTFVKVRVTEVKAIGKRNYFGFTLLEDPLFLLEDDSIVSNCGKSTLAYSLCSILKKRGKNVVVLNELARECPFPINQGAEDNTHIWIACKQIIKELEYGKLYEWVIADRSVLDSFAYAEILEQKGWTYKELEPYLVKHIKNNYHRLYLLDPKAFNFNVVDGVRDNDEEFRTKVHEKLIEILERNNIDYTVVFDSTDIYIDAQEL